jgi:hypothetical protein
VALLANLHLPGTGVVAVGLVANLVPVLLVGATPVEPRALEAVRTADALHPTQVLVTDTTPVPVLASHIPVPLTGDVVSFGDLVVAVGLAAMARSLLRPPPRRRIPVQEILDDGPLTLAALDAIDGGGGTPERQEILDDGPLIDLTTERVGHRLGEHPVEVGPGQPVPVPVGWERDDDGVRPPGSASLRPRRSRAHPTMRLTHR